MIDFSTLLRVIWTSVSLVTAEHLSIVLIPVFWQPIKFHGCHSFGYALCKRYTMQVSNGCGMDWLQQQPMRPVLQLPCYMIWLYINTVDFFTDYRRYNPWYVYFQFDLRVTLYRPEGILLGTQKVFLNAMVAHFNWWI